MKYTTSFKRYNFRHIREKGMSHLYIFYLQMRDEITNTKRSEVNKNSFFIRN